MNFEFLKAEHDFDVFSDIAITSEKIINDDTGLCVINC